ncbi:IclR family transcriptional regulator [Streptosporangium sp. NPDC004631]
MARPRQDSPATAPHSQTLDRGIRLLEAVAEANEPQSLEDLAIGLGVHRSIAYRMLRTLEDHRLVRRRAGGRYEPGFGLSVLARSVSRPLQAAAMPELIALANSVGMTAFLVVREGEEAVTISSVEPRYSTAHVSYRPGTRHPIDHGAPGVALLAGEPPRDGERREVTLCRARGYATSSGEVITGLSAVASPITSRGELAGAIAVVGLDSQCNHPEIGAEVKVAADRIAAELA